MIVEHEVKVRHEHNDLDTIEVLCKGEYVEFVRERTCRLIEERGLEYIAYCSSCGSEMPEDPNHHWCLNYCPNCGRKVER